jgi:hypothetical protein
MRYFAQYESETDSNALGYQVELVRFVERQKMRAERKETLAELVNFRERQQDQAQRNEIPPEVARYVERRKQREEKTESQVGNVEDQAPHIQQPTASSSSAPTAGR